MATPFARWSSLLPRLFLIATVLPAAALSWLGWQLVEQDRRLERQRVQDVVESAANGIAAAIERELGTIERNLGSVADATGAPSVPASVTVRLSAEGRATVTAGTPLVYHPAPVPSTELAASLWAGAERLEYARRDVPASIRAYRTLARSADLDVRAGALIRLARVLKNSGLTDEALATYGALAATSGARILGDPADLMARWARVELLATLERSDALRAEATALDADLRRGRWPLDRTTAMTYWQALRRWRSDSAEASFEAQIALSDAVAAVWKEWQARSPSQPLGGGRRSIRASTGEVLVVWRESGEELLAFAASPVSLLDTWQHLWPATNVAVELENHDGQPIAGETSPSSSVFVVKAALDTRLPWTLRIAATSTPADIAVAGAARRRVIVAVLVLLAVLIPATGYLVTRIVRKELALARQQAEFVSTVSHEFRSPLTSLTHLTSLLRSDFQPTSERRRQYYDVLAHETDRLRRFVETLLDFGRIQAGAARYHLAPVDPRAVITKVVEEFRDHATAGAHQVLFDAPARVPDVAADVEALGRALWNLLENAAKYSPDESPIGVRLEEDDGRVAIRVIDRGSGIPASEQPFIFDQFFRGAAASESAVKGTGVGLAVVRHIVLAHGGDIRLDSTPGIGSTFSIVLPAASREASSARERRVS